MLKSTLHPTKIPAYAVYPPLLTVSWHIGAGTAINIHVFSLRLSLLLAMFLFIFLLLICLSINLILPAHKYQHIDTIRGHKHEHFFTFMFYERHSFTYMQHMSGNINCYYQGLLPFMLLSKFMKCHQIHTGKLACPTCTAAKTSLRHRTSKLRHSLLLLEGRQFARGHYHGT